MDADGQRRMAKAHPRRSPRGARPETQTAATGGTALVRGRQEPESLEPRPKPRVPVISRWELEPQTWGIESDDPPVPVRLAPRLPEEPTDPDGEPLALVDEPGQPVAGMLANIGGVKFHSVGKVYEADAGDGAYALGDPVVVETERGTQIGVIASAPRRQIARAVRSRILRLADDRDKATYKHNAIRATDALRCAKERAHHRNLPIKMFRVEIAPSGNRALFYFSSEDRVDFRELARELAQKYHLRVEMRQTGVRDEAKLVGGIGSCGQSLCCSTFLPKFEPVSIRMAKDQGLVLNPSKVTGQCGRLKCCLVYEEEIYRELRKGLPKPGKRVISPAGQGRVVEVDVLGQRIRVALESGDSQTFPVGEVRPVLAEGTSSKLSAEPSIEPVISGDDGGSSEAPIESDGDGGSSEAPIESDGDGGSSEAPIESDGDGGSEE